MSVPRGKRKESNLKYIQDAHLLAQHTLQLCDNENHFPDSILAKAIKHEALEILCNARYNLATYTYEKENKQLLKRYVCDILAHIDALYGLLEVAYNNKNCHLTADTMEYWIGLVINVEESVKKLGSVPICCTVVRSPCWVYADHERSVSLSGSAYDSTAGSSYAVMPDCKETYSYNGARPL